MGLRDRIPFENYDAGALPFDKTRFDAVFLFGVLHHVEEGARADVLREALRIFKNDGAVVLFEPLPETVEKILVNDPGYPPAADPSVYASDLNARESHFKGFLMDISIYRSR